MVEKMDRRRSKESGGKVKVNIGDISKDCDADRICTFRLSGNKIIVKEQCDGYFEVALSRLEITNLIERLSELRNAMKV